MSITDSTKWILEAKRADFYGLAEKFGLDPLTIRLAVNRGVRTEEEIRRYFYADWRDEHDPHLMKGAAEAAARIREAVIRGEEIWIASDFDVDGIFSGLILATGIRRIGGQARVEAPHRVKEGYGVNIGMVERAFGSGLRTMVTCDNGIAAFEAVARARELGMEVIVTDHHSCQFVQTEEGEQVRLPAADVIVNPHQPGCEYPFKGLCGAGVAYKVIRLLYEQCGLAREESLPLLEYAAIATVTDVMDLTDENRIIVREGLRRLNHTDNPGLKALIDVCGLKDKTLTAYHIGFILGPSFNSAGRLDTVDLAFRLLTGGEEDVYPLAERLRDMNEARKKLTVQGVEAGIAWVEAREQLEDVLVIPLADCHESIAGIVAGKIREYYHHPVIVLTRGEEGWKGSGRSIPAWNMFRGLMACESLMTRFGGHAMAAGLSLPEENIPVLRDRLNRDSGLTEEDFIPIIKIDAAMPLEYITEDRIREMSLLEPFGKGNVRPLFAEKEFLLRSARVLGKNRNVLKMTVENMTGARMDALFYGDIDGFNAYAAGRFGDEAVQEMYRGRGRSVRMSLAYYPEINEYCGRRTLQIVVQQYK